MALKAPATFGGGINSKDVTSSISGEESLLKVGSISFGSPSSDSSVSIPIFEIKATEQKTNISTPMMYVSSKNAVSFGSLDASAPPKISGGGFANYYNTSGSGGY